MKKIAKIFVIICALSFALPKSYAQVSVGISVGIAPPPLPVYVQPPCPVDGYLWQPGYWAYNDADGYYWVPGVWVAPPDPGLLWTPAYWGYAGGVYGFHAGYWGPHVGFYGGINYGFGYGGVGFVGGGWSGGHFRYNTAVVNVNRTVVHNTYINRTVIHNTNNRTSFNGPGGVNARPTPQENAAMRDHHIGPTSSQMSHQQNASKDRGQFASVNHGKPSSAAMNRVSGRPFDANGHTAKNTAFGHGNTAPGNHQAASPTRNTAFGHGNAAQSTHQATSPARNTAFGHSGGQAARPAGNAQPQQRVQPQQHIQQAQHMQQAQHVQQPRMQQQRAPQPRMQPHAQPHGGGGGRHR